MEQWRVKPDLNLDEPYFHWVKGVIFIALSVFPTLLAILFVSGWVEIRGTEAEKMICGIGMVLVFIPLGLWQAGMVVREMLRERRCLAEKQRWLESASTAQAVIVDRIEEHNEQAESQEEMWITELVFRLPALPGELADEVLVRARVSEEVYGKYRHQDTARIYYAKTNPYQFLIEGE